MNLTSIDLRELASMADAGLTSVGLPDATASAAIVLTSAALAMGLTDIAKGVLGRGAETTRQRYAMRALTVALGVLVGVSFCVLGRVSALQGLFLGLAGGLAAPGIWTLMVPWLRARGVR